MDIKDVLHQLGVGEHRLTAEERHALDEHGYLLIPEVLPRALVKRMMASLDAIAEREGEEAGKDFQVEEGTTRLGTLINKDAVFDACVFHPKALAAVWYIMGDDFGLSSITGRAALPGEGGQGLHRDSSHRSCNVLWMVTDFTPDNGPTRLVPGSHRFDGDPRMVLENPAAPYPDEAYLIAPAGSMVVINGYTWHGGTRNNSAKRRHLISAFWLPRGLYQPEAHRRLSDAARRRLSPAAKRAIDFEE